MRRRWWRVLVITLWILLGCSVTVYADDWGGISLIGQDLILERGQTVHGSVAVVAGRVQVEQGAAIEGDLAIVGGAASIDGTVDGDIVVLGGNMALGAQSIVRGDIVVLGTLERDPGAHVEGQVVVTGERTAQLNTLQRRIQEQTLFPPTQSASARGENLLGWMVRVLRWAGILVALAIVAFLFSAVASEPIQHVAEVMERSFPLSVAVGLVTLLVLIVAMPLLVIIVVGIPVAVIVGVALGLAFILAGVAAARLIGRRCMVALKVVSSSVLLDTVVGLVMLALLSRVPCLGGLMLFVVMLWGLGAVVLTRFGTSPHLVWAPFEPLAGTAGLRAEAAPEHPNREVRSPFAEEEEDPPATRRLGGGF